MKIINVNAALTPQQIQEHLSRNINVLFHVQTQTDLNFVVEQKDNAVEIYQPDLYEGFLFRIEPHVLELWITRSEHYVDDVNSLTLESVLNKLFEDLAGDKGVKIVIEG